MKFRITQIVFIVGVFTTLLFFNPNLYSQAKFYWGRQLGTEAEDFGKSIGIDGADNIYISGWTMDSLGGTIMGENDVFLIKLNQEGKVLWKRQFGTNSDEQAEEIAVDKAGNCFVTGWTKGNLGIKNIGDSDIFLVKYDSTGNQLWTHQLGTEKADVGHFIALDELGNIYITGSTEGSLASENMGKKDVFLSKHDADGNLVFKQQFGTSETDIGRGLSLDKNGNIYVCGIVGGNWGEPNIENMDAFLAKFNTNGKLLWKKTYGTDNFDVATSLQVDKDGFIYVGGSTGGELGGSQAGQGDAYIAKFDSLGNKIWIRQFGRDKWDGVLSIVFSRDQSGDIIISGCQNWESCEGYCRRYNNNGDLKWVREFIHQGESGTCGKDVAIDALGNCFHIGGTGASIFSDNKGKHDVYVVKIIDKQDIEKFKVEIVRTVSTDSKRSKDSAINRVFWVS